MSADSALAGATATMLQPPPCSRAWTSKPSSLSDSSVQVALTLVLPVGTTVRPVGAVGRSPGGGGGGGGGSPGSGK